MPEHAERQRIPNSTSTKLSRRRLPRFIRITTNHERAVDPAPAINFARSTKQRSDEPRHICSISGDSTKSAIYRRNPFRDILKCVFRKRTSALADQRILVGISSK